VKREKLARYRLPKYREAEVRQSVEHYQSAQVLEEISFLSCPRQFVLNNFSLLLDADPQLPAF